MLGFLATIIAFAIENAVVVGGVAALGAMLYSIGMPKDSVFHYESAIKADSFLFMARGAAQEIARAGTILGVTHPSRLDIHRDADAVAPAASPAPAAAWRRPALWPAAADLLAGENVGSTNDRRPPDATCANARTPCTGGRKRNFGGSGRLS